MMNVNNNMPVNHDSDLITLNAEEYSAIRKECSYYEDKRAALVAALKIIQKTRGWVSDDAIILIAKVLSVSAVDVESVATFYSQIFRQPVGRHIIRYCDSVVCYITGCEKIKEVLECKLHIAMGETTLDNRFTLLPVSCLGVCDKSPAIMIDEDTYLNINLSNIEQLLRHYP